MQIIDWTDVRQPEQYLYTPIGPDTVVVDSDVVRTVKRLFDKWAKEKERLVKIDHWMKGSQEPPEVNHPAREVKKLLQYAPTPWLGLVVTTLSQALLVDGFKSPDSGKMVEGPWRTWTANGLPSRQIALHRAALGYGYSFMLGEEGIGQDGSRRAVMRGMSPKRMFAEYDDPSFDDWPTYAIRVDGAADKSALVWLYDETFAHKLRYKPDSGVNTWTLLSSTPHNVGVVPVVRYTNQLDLDGNTPGEVEPFVGVAARIDKTMFDRLLTQHYNSWKKMWIAGLTEPPKDEADAQRQKMKLRQDDILIAESVETKFGAIPETSLEGFLQAIDSDIEDLASLAQLPSWLFTGKLSNLSTDTLAAANKPLTQKVYERQISFGDSHARSLRLAARIEGDEDAANDIFSRATWQDVEVRSLAQAADALGKFATQLGIPRKALWSMIPGVTPLDIEEWYDMMLDDDPSAAYLRKFDKLETAKPAAGVTPPDNAAPGVNAPDAGAE